MNKQIKIRGGQVIGRGIEWAGTSFAAPVDGLKTHPWTLPDGRTVHLVDNGRTSNPIGGCHFGCRWHMPDGSTAICYAERVAEKLARAAYPDGFAPMGADGKQVYWRPDELISWTTIKQPQEIFVGSQADVFGPWVPERYQWQMFEAMAAAPQHRYYILTKNAPAVSQWATYKPNEWVGVSLAPSVMGGQELSAHAQTRMLTRALDSLLETESQGVKWLSLEPLSWDPYATLVAWIKSREVKLLEAIQWVVIGAATSGAKTYQPQWDWVRGLLWLLEGEGVRVFFKGNLRTPAGWRWREDKPEQSRVIYVNDQAQLVLNPDQQLALEV